MTLESALQQFGPAAFDDLIPRLQTLAADLDEAHAAGFVHGRLHPGKIIVTEDGTFLMGRRVPVTATLTPAVDQAAFAVIAYEWMFGRRVLPGAAVAPSPPSGVDRGRLSQALTRALSQERDRQYPTILDFVDALESAQIPELPLMAAADEADPFEPFVPEGPVRVAPPFAAPPVFAAAPGEPVSEAASASTYATADKPARSASVEATARQAASESPRFGGFALILATIVGAILGFAAGYMARPRALQQPAPAAVAPAEPSASAPTGSPAPARTPPQEPSASARPQPKERSASAPSEPAELRRIERIGRLLVRSTPSGASVSVDGVARGVTPLAIRDLELGSREIAVTRRGYQSDERRIVLTKARPSRTVDVRLSASASASAPSGRSGETGTSPPRPSTPASLGKPPATTGTLAIESRPAGAAVLVNGKPSGVTPVTLNDLPPGEYRVTMTLKGYRDFATTVRVMAGARARAAARLTEQEQE